MMTYKMPMAIQSNIWSFIIKATIASILLLSLIQTNLAQADDEDYSLVGVSDLSNYTNEYIDESDDKDPYEKLNRKVFKFNEKLDKIALKPLAKGYRKVVPSAVRTGVRNVFNHVDDLFVISNDVLQAKPKQALKDTARFIFNSTFGVLGVFDVASHMELPKHDEDFGQTLGKWGVKPGPYIVVPFLGPNSLRSLSGDIVHYAAGNNATLDKDYVLNPAKNLSHTADRNGIAALEIIDKREALLDTEDILDTFAIDRYAAVRNAYLQNREYLTHDGDTDDEFDANEESLIESKPTEG